MKALLRSAVVAALTITAAQSAFAQFMIDTRGPYDNQVSGGVGIYGQTFIATGPSPVLNNFVVFAGGTGVNGYDFRTSIYRFDGSKPTGPALWQGPTVHTLSTYGVGTQAGWLWFTSALALVEGQSYIALIQRTEPGAIMTALARTDDAQYASVYDGGAFYYATAWAEDPTSVAYGTDFLAPGVDLVFATNAPLVTAPEPASFALIATGLLAVIGVRRRYT